MSSRIKEAICEDCENRFYLVFSSFLDWFHPYCRKCLLKRYPRIIPIKRFKTEKEALLECLLGKE